MAMYVNLLLVVFCKVLIFGIPFCPGGFNGGTGFWPELHVVAVGRLKRLSDLAPSSRLDSGRPLRLWIHPVQKRTEGSTRLSTRCQSGLRLRAGNKNPMATSLNPRFRCRLDDRHFQPPLILPLPDLLLTHHLCGLRGGGGNESLPMRRPTLFDPQCGVDG
ncbi:hypothetical protein DAEQUDRAFT_362097 [Daedalea quercina L-15889]|uniref:Secreted protein n=1 Tax=Daedalea quercina L-15889 TaxID=1314783 RepID=A0A165TTT5_9APHY|nr:hypothetical protein DAEQUDRAFT_362097 [Daedalea quercina L-15889]